MGATMLLLLKTIFKDRQFIQITALILDKDLFEEIKGDQYSIMGMPIKPLIKYFELNEK